MYRSDDNTYPWDDDRTDEMQADAIADCCAHCTGPLHLIGSLGALETFRCRACGAYTHRKGGYPLAPIAPVDDSTESPF